MTRKDDASARSGEDRLIDIFRPLARHPGAFGLMDDAAVLTPPAGADLVLKTDAIVGGVHFFADDAPDTVARKALRVNLSDLAAKGAQPAGFLLSLALPADVSEAWLAAFAAGLGADAEQYSCPLLGGDTDRTPGPITISIAAFGTLPQGSMIRRSGARVDDRILVTGSIGDAALGLEARRVPDAARRWKLTPAEADHLAQRYLLPQPRNALAEAVRLHATAAMDISDGLAGDLGKLCAASGISAEVEAMRVPLSEAARAACTAEPSVIETILTGGDDYEIVCTMPAAKLGSFRAAAAAAKVAVTEIGSMRAGEGAPRFLDGAGKTLVFKRASFSHF